MAMDQHHSCTCTRTHQFFKKKTVSRRLFTLSSALNGFESSEFLCLFCLVPLLVQLPVGDDAADDDTRGQGTAALHNTEDPPGLGSLRGKDNNLTPSINNSSSIIPLLFAALEGIPN